ncbi:MAG: phage tail protein, partial [Prevotella sp.]
MKKVFRWIGIVLLSPILLFVILTILIYIPPVQNLLVQRAASIASEQTGLDVSVGHISLAFPLDLSIKDVRITQNNDSLPQVRDTIADIGRLIIDVQLCPLFDGKVVVEEMLLDDCKINTANFIGSARIKGSLERLSVKSRGIDLGKQTVELDGALLKGARFNVELSDTVPPDTTTSETLWKIYIDKVEIASTDVCIHMPGDTLQIAAGIGNATVKDGEIDLGRSLYRLASFEWNDGSLAYDNNFEPRSPGLDFNHLSFTGIGIGIDSVYYCSPDARLHIRNFSLKEKSGIEVTQMEGNIAMDATRIQLPSLTLRTPDSDIEAHVSMDLNALDSINPGKVDVRLLASLGKQDVMRFCGDMPKQFILRYPNHPISVRGSLNGNMQHLDITGLQVSLPTAFSCSAEGFADNTTDMKRMKADIRLNAKTFNIGFLTALAGPDALNGIRIPSGITLDGRLRADGERYSADLTARECQGKVTVKGSFDAQVMAYEARMDIQELNLHHFIPNDSLYTITASANLKGRGTDFLSRRTQVVADASLDKFEFGSLTIDGIGAALLVKDGVGHAEIKGQNELFDGTITADALLDTKRIESTLGFDLRKADLFRLRMVEKAMTVGACAHIDISSDLDQYHALKGYC